jgi:branched-chain amino acid transport system ATP-binding protein
MLRRLREEGLTILLVEQNIRVALQISDYAYVLSEGRVTIEGPAEMVEGNPEVQKAYLGL